ncbi:MAG: adenylate/guanylate cyclase domain-containing protein [Candidatus Limnocylindrales bacterium]
MTDRICPTCGEPTPDRFQWCGHCGTRLVTERGAEDIRRFATVVNSDLKGSTALGERLDPETLREVLTLYFDEMKAVFESHGGTIEKIIGDAIVAVFGVPVRREDDALRAVQACAESQRVLATLNDRLDAAWGVRLVVRTGVATGDVVFGEATLGQHVLAGDTMKISSAMEQNAPPLEVLLAESTYAFVKDDVEVELVEPVTPKGMDVVVPAYRLVSVTSRQAGQVGADASAAGLRICPACGEENSEQFRLCGMCGATLAVATPARDSRKTVTLVFADPKPTTLDGSPPSAEALRDVMTDYFGAMRVALERHGGTVEKFIGDAVMAVFGLPVRHEDDAVRAVRAAADMQAALPTLNDEFRARWGLELRNHIGVNTGEVIAGDASLGQRLVTGDAVNTAARLEQAAGPAEIVLGELTYRLARSHIEVEPLPPLQLKGKAEPVPAYRFIRVKHRVDEGAAGATPFVGRAVEMARLRDALADAEGKGVARLVTVIGDAGVGKSRLVREFAESLGDTAQVVRGRCLPYGDGITFWPIGEIVRSVGAIDDDDDATAAIAKVANLARRASTDADESEDIAARVAAAIGLGTGQYQMPELFWGIRKLLEAMAHRQPLAVIIDDIHSAAPAFLELLDHLLEAVAEAPMLLLTTARHEVLETHDEWTTAHEAERITLEPLTSADADSIVGQLLAGLDSRVQVQIVDASEGNPLYVEQITSMLVETGAIRREGERWIPTAKSGQVPIPPTVQALVAARLDALGRDERAVVEPASVIGLSFPVDAVMELVGDELRPGVPTHLGALKAKQLVRPATGSEEETFRFGHVVIKDTAYGSLLKRQRATLHQQFVDWAERDNEARGRSTEFEEIHGYHLEQAYRYLTDLGTLDDRAQTVGRRAAEKLASAGRRALSRADMSAAADLLRRSVALLPAADGLRIQLLPELAEAQFELGDLDAMGETVALAVTEATESGDPMLLARAQLAAAMHGLFTGARAGEETDPAAEVEAITTRLERARDDAGLARAWRMHGMIASKAGRYDDASAAAERMIDHALAAGEQRLVARGASAYASTAVISSKPVDEVFTRLEQLLRDVAGDRKAEGRLALELAQVHAMRGEFEEAQQLVRRGQELIWDLGPSISAMTTSIQSARVFILAGDLHAAEAELRRDDERLAAINETYFRSTITTDLARVLWDEGRADEAAAFCDIAERIADEDDTDSQIGWRLVRSRTLLAAGDAVTADRLSREAVDVAATSTDLLLQANVLLDRATLLASISGPESAGPPLREALRLFELKGDRVSAARARDLLAAGASV